MVSVSVFFSCSLISLLWEKVNGIEAFGGGMIKTISSKLEKVLLPSSSANELKLLNPTGNISLKLSHKRCVTASFDFESEEDAFYDCEERPCPAPESKDVSHTANGVFNSCSWSCSSDSENIIMMTMGSSSHLPPKSTCIVSKTEAEESVPSSEESNVSYYFQDQFWNHDYRHADLYQRNKLAKLEEERKLVQFLEDSFWFHQADDGTRRKTRSLPCFPCRSRRKSKEKPHSNVSSQQNHSSSQLRNTNEGRTSSFDSCFPISLSWLRSKSRGAQKLKPAPVHH